MPRRPRKTGGLSQQRRGYMTPRGSRRDGGQSETRPRV